MQEMNFLSNPILSTSSAWTVKYIYVIYLLFGGQAPPNPVFPKSVILWIASFDSLFPKPVGNDILFWNIKKLPNATTSCWCIWIINCNCKRFCPLWCIFPWKFRWIFSPLHLFNVKTIKNLFICHILSFYF